MERVLCDISLPSYDLIPIFPDWWRPQADNRRCNWIVLNASLSEGMPWKRRWFTFSSRSHNSTWLVWKTIASTLPFAGKDFYVDTGFTVVDSPDKMDYLELFQSGFLPGTEIVCSWVYLWYQPGQQRYNPPVVFDLLVAFSSVNHYCLLDCLQGVGVGEKALLLFMCAIQAGERRKSLIPSTLDCGVPWGITSRGKLVPSSQSCLLPIAWRNLLGFFF